MIQHRHLIRSEQAVDLLKKASKNCLKYVQEKVYQTTHVTRKCSPGNWQKTRMTSDEFRRLKTI